MTSHELARLLLSLPDKHAVVSDGCCSTYDVVGAHLPGTVQDQHDDVFLAGRDDPGVIILEVT